MYIYKKLICKAKMDDSEVNIMVGQEKIRYIIEY